MKANRIQHAEKFHYYALQLDNEQAVDDIP